MAFMPCLRWTTIYLVDSWRFAFLIPYLRPQGCPRLECADRARKPDGASAPTPSPSTPHSFFLFCCSQMDSGRSCPSSKRRGSLLHILSSSSKSLCQALMQINVDQVFNHSNRGFAQWRFSLASPQGHTHQRNTTQQCFGRRWFGCKDFTKFEGNVRRKEVEKKNRRWCGDEWWWSEERKKERSQWTWRRRKRKQELLWKEMLQLHKSAEGTVQMEDGGWNRHSSELERKKAMKKRRTGEWR